MAAESEKILIGCTVRQSPDILKQFLLSLAKLDRSGLHVDCFFFNNNDNEDSAKLITTFKMADATIFWASEKPTEPYHCTEETHIWNDSLIWQIAAFKDFILNFALENNYSHVFMVDSDLVLHPQTLKMLLAAKKDIISEIFWTAWTLDMDEMPNVWISGQYSFDNIAFLHQLKEPGIYEVGGLGACTLISARALALGVNYQQISNVDYWGEDRHFCIRAKVLGLELYVDTHYPAIHLYRESDLSKVKALQKTNRWQRKKSGNKLTLAMIVRNEEGRYLKRVLEHARQYIDAAVIIDDASHDNTVDICREVLKSKPLKLISQKRSTFSTEYKLRKKLWQETIKTNPDWILVLDADEIFEDKIVSEISSMINQCVFDLYSFRLYDFWDEYHYREDQYWKAHLTYRPFLARYIPTFKAAWLETPQHCGRLPLNITELKGTISPLRIKHFGWANAQGRKEKYNRYLKLDPSGRYGIEEQYKSIMDLQPNLVKWKI